VDLGLVFGLLGWFRKAAYKERVVETANATIFRVCLPARCFFGGGILLCGVCAAASFMVDGVPEYVRIGYIPAFLILFTRWPWSLRLDHEGVSRRSYFGTARMIAWVDVTGLAYERRSGRFTIGGRTGEKIRCSPFMVDPTLFYVEMHKRATALGPMPKRGGPQPADIDPVGAFQAETYQLAGTLGAFPKSKLPLGPHRPDTEKD